MGTVNTYIVAQNEFSERFQWFVRTLDQNQTDWAQWKRVVEARKAVNAAWERLR